MTTTEILDQMRRVHRTPPRAALQAAEAQRAALTPHLLASLAELVARPAILREDPGLQLPIYAMYLLAAWREPRAHPLLLSFLGFPGEENVDLLGDIVTEDMDRILAQTAGGDHRGLVALTHDHRLSEWVHAAAIGALGWLQAWGELPRTDLITSYREMVAEAGPPSSEEISPLATHVFLHAQQLQLVEMREELLVLLDRGWIDEYIVGDREEAAAEFDLPFADRRDEPIEDVAEAIRWWGCFRRAGRQR